MTKLVCQFAPPPVAWLYPLQQIRQRLLWAIFTLRKAERYRLERKVVIQGVQVNDELHLP